MNKSKTDTNLVVVVLGVSRSGKDTTADYLVEDYGFEVTHMLSDYYEFLEEHFDLEKGSLRGGSSKQLKMPGSNITYAEFLVKQFHLCEEAGILFTSPFIQKVLKNVNKNTVLTGVRNFHEALPIISLRFGEQEGIGGAALNLNPNYEVLPILIERPGYLGFTSDVNVYKLVKLFEEHGIAVSRVTNDGTIPELYSKIDEVIMEAYTN